MYNSEKLHATYLITHWTNSIESAENSV